jgi:inositol 1,4,5-triphosphate receptor type 1/inositol 1,4,5-triphosphate receptor type 3
LVEEAPKIIEVCKHEQKLALFFARQKFVAVFANFVDLWRDIAFLLTILINIFILISYSQGDSDNPD